MNMKWYAVRCCCTPQKVFGFIRLQDGIRTAKVKLRNGNTAEVHMKESCHISHSVFITEPADEVVKRTYEMAIYSEDRPIQFWRQVEGFVEVA